MYVETNCQGVDCPCCSACYDSVEDMRRIDVLQSCELEIRNRVFEESRKNHCDCSPPSQERDVYSVYMDCSETCQSCSSDGSICATNVDYGYGIDVLGNARYAFSTFRYVRGLDALVGFESRRQSVDGCTVWVNGEQCRHCSTHRCLDGWQGYSVQCDNLDGVGSFNHCGGSSVDGPLAVFGMQDSRHLRGCQPFMPLFDD